MTGLRLVRGFSEDARRTAASLYWAAFEAKLGVLLGPQVRGEAFFARVLNPAFAIGAYNGDRLVGLAGFKTAQGALTEGGWRDLTDHYRLLGAIWRAPLLSMLERPVERDVLLMDGICVDASVRGKGLGTGLLDAVKDVARDMGLRRVRLDVIDSNLRAKALYERQGFVACGRTRTGLLRPVLGFAASTQMEAPV